jgi:predicted ATPase
MSGAPGLSEDRQVEPHTDRATRGGHTHAIRGRDAELTVLGQHLDDLLSGVGTVVLVEGGAGMGKSRLLGEAEVMARRLGLRVGRGVADPADSVVQLAVLMEALFEGHSPILERTALSDAHTALDQRFWLLQDLEALLEEAALKGPLFVCLDDVHWADNGTAAALRALTSRLATVPIGWVIALRPGQASPQVRNAADFLMKNGAAIIRLAPLDQAGVAKVAADILGAEPDGELLKMAERSAGSPFLLV